MGRYLVVAALAAGIALAPGLASAQERLGDGLMGAAAGAAVGGPIGAAVGGFIGFVHGPGIASGLGLRGHRCHGHCYHRAYAYRGRHVYR